jgi:hypothetical protein
MIDNDAALHSVRNAAMSCIQMMLFLSGRLDRTPVGLSGLADGVIEPIALHRVLS